MKCSWSQTIVHQGIQKVAHMNFPNSIISKQLDIFIFLAVLYAGSGGGDGQSSCIEFE